MTRLVASPLVRAAYAPFGDVIAADPSRTPRSANYGTAAKYDHIATLENLRAAARPHLSIFRSSPAQALPFEVKLLEKHAASTQMFVPTGAARYLVLVAHGHESPDLSTLRAFVARDVGITYRPGIWHHPMIVLDAPADFLCLVWEDGTAEDCTECAVSPAWHIEVA